MPDDAMPNHAANSDTVVVLPFAPLRARVACVAARRFPRWGDSAGSTAVRHAMQEVYRMIERVAPTDATVFITGESGCGKELVARTIHERSPRARAAVRRDQLRRDSGEPDRGRAVRPREGRVHRRQPPAPRAASSGPTAGRCSSTRSPRWPPEMQVRLLRVLETGRYIRVGGDRRARRPTCASSRRPTAIRAARCATAMLREDLMYRLAVFPIALPPLRERDGDAELLAEHFLRELNAEAGTDKRFSRAALRRDPHAPLARQRARAEERRASRIHPRRRRRRARPRRRSRGPAADGRLPRVPVGTSLAEMERQAIYRDARPLPRQQAARAPRSWASASRRSTTVSPPTRRGAVAAAG